LNDLESRFPDLALEWHPTKNRNLHPRDVAAGSGKSVWWLCPNGHDYSMPLERRTGKQASGCDRCTTTGFKKSVDGYLYLLHHDDWGLQKIGITNEPETRIATHERLGFVAVDIEGPMPGDLALNWETSILKELKKAGIDIPSKVLKHQFSGWSECWFESQFRVDQISELREFVEDRENPAG